MATVTNPSSSSDESPSPYLNVALRGAPPVVAVVEHTVNSDIAITIPRESDWPPPVAQIDLTSIPGFAPLLAAYTNMEITSFSITFARIPKADYDIFAAITPSGWGDINGSAKVAEDRLISGLASAPGRSVSIFRSTNTAVDSITQPVLWPIGVSTSLISVFPGIHRPALTIGIRQIGANVPDRSRDRVYYSYITAIVRCQGHAYPSIL